MRANSAISTTRQQMRQKTDAEYADDLVKFIGHSNNAKVVLDPSAASFKAELWKRGIWQVDADNEVEEGIRIVSMVLNQRMVRFCRQTAPRTLQEMQTYAWDSKAAQRGEEKPLKTHDHGPDAFATSPRRRSPIGDWPGRSHTTVGIRKELLVPSAIGVATTGKTPI